MTLKNVPFSTVVIVTSPHFSLDFTHKKNNIRESNRNIMSSRKKLLTTMKRSSDKKYDMSRVRLCLLLTTSMRKNLLLVYAMLC
ncbi:CLUMA_CG009600, isoform A [Clunio marinus]|uniref:CLUMA_CG009600, isoform A n=1 Tax=Clunio marinus TaxID=568069 RepID=A0A1J1I7K7_9DIPT|nr:CLUMA_CG009600, isoform A [Clunio marinus]